MSLPNSFNEADSNTQRPVEANGTSSNDPAFPRIIPAKDKRIEILSEDGKKVINKNKGFLDQLAYHMDGPLKLHSNEYVKNYRCPAKSLKYFGQPTAITYQDARSPVTSVEVGKPGTPIVSKVFPFFISKSCSDPRTMVFNIKDICYITRYTESCCGVREALTTIISDFKKFTSIEHDIMNPICPQKAKIANNYDEFPFSRVIASSERMRFSPVRLFLGDSIIKSYNVEQIEELLEELLRFVEASGEGKLLSKFRSYEVEVSITALSNRTQVYHFHLGKKYNMDADQRNKLEISVESILRHIARYGYSGLNAHPAGLCRGVVMLPSIQNFKLVTTSEKEGEKNSSRKIGQPPPYKQ